MDERFGAWLRDAMADIDDDILKRRWSGVESLADDLGDWEILDLVLYCTNCRMRNAETLQKAQKAFWTHDNAFKMDGNDLELRRLCGVVVIHVLSGESKHKMDIALAIVCLHFGGSHDDFGLPAMAEEAEKTLQSLSVAIRSAGGISQYSITPSKVLAKLKKAIEEDQAQLPISDLEQIFSQYKNGLDQLAADNRNIRSALEIQKEETDILWWLTGAYSNDLKRPFKDFDRSIAAVIAGKELADHVTHRPGPLSIPNILDRMLLHSAGDIDAVSLRTVVTKIPMDWRKQLAPKIGNLALDYCPLLAAIWNSVELDDATSWDTPFSKRFPHSIEREISPVLLAYQMYREWMLTLNLSTWE